MTDIGKAWTTRLKRELTAPEMTAVKATTTIGTGPNHRRVKREQRKAILALRPKKARYN
jgi:hypothetical protein